MNIEKRQWPQACVVRYFADYIAGVLLEQPADAAITNPPSTLTTSESEGQRFGAAASFSSTMMSATL